ncbi:MAG: type II/IV secretion system protein [Candidatus Terrybacteria bacterium]|nr:type II/IV secretion system protein [Candidatus Terrybacteria bacterium]
MIKFASEKDSGKIKEMREKEAEDLTQILAQKYNLPYLDLSRVTIDLDTLRLVPEEKAREAKLVAFQKTGKKLLIAIQSPNLETTRNLLKDLESRNFKMEIYLVSETSLQRAWKRYAEVPEYVEISKGIIDVSAQKMEEFIAQIKTIEDLKNLFSTAISTQKTRKISEILEIVLAGAVSADASDIHIEPQENEVRLRFRLDGVLHDITFFDKKMYNLFLSRIKLVSGLKLNIHDQAQDGRFSIHIKETEVEVRVSVIPENYGESIVMRILNPKSISVSFEELGIEKNLFEKLAKEIGKPNGMILTTGPTGSGKTTTLYAFLKKIYNPEIKIITLENPVEYHLTGIIQTQIEPEKGYTFANGLRAILRQDPDVIMVGEIRDLETAQIAINAALTGHLVLSTLHTNNAAGTIPRFLDLGVTTGNLVSALNVSMAQRLVRKLCNKCKEKYEPVSEEKETVEKIIKTLPLDYEQPTVSFLWKAKGCSECNNIGYKGRIGIYEAILMDENIEKVAMEKPTESKIWGASKGQNILNMQQDGILKALNGVTSLDELRRVVEL